jgi:hypothetical protein
MVKLVVFEYYDIVEAVISKVDKMMSVDKFEPEVQNIGKELIDFPMWLNILYEEIVKNELVKVDEGTENDLLTKGKEEYCTHTAGSGKEIIESVRRR